MILFMDHIHLHNHNLLTAREGHQCIRYTFSYPNEEDIVMIYDIPFTTAAIQNNRIEVSIRYPLYEKVSLKTEEAKAAFRKAGTHIENQIRDFILEKSLMRLNLLMRDIKICFVNY